MSSKHAGYQPWTEADRARLLEVVKQHTRRVGRVRWGLVAEAFPGRSVQQLKSYYRNIARGSAGSEQRPDERTIYEQFYGEVPKYDRDRWDGSKTIRGLSVDEEITLLFRFLLCDRKPDVLRAACPAYSSAQLINLMTRWRLRMQHMMMKMPFILLYPEGRAQANFDLDALTCVSVEIGRLSDPDDSLAAGVRAKLTEYYSRPDALDKFYQFGDFSVENLRAVKAKIDRLLAAEGRACENQLTTSTFCR